MPSHTEEVQENGSHHPNHKNDTEKRHHGWADDHFVSLINN